MKLDMMDNLSTGKLITFCGLDGCGKTTQIRRLQQHLEGKGYKVYLTKQPTDFVRNSEIFRNYMDTPSHDEFDYRALSLLCASDRVQHSNRVINRRLEEGYVVISDRYFYSCLANLIARGYEQDGWIYEVARSIRRPDVAFFSISMWIPPSAVSVPEKRKRTGLSICRCSTGCGSNTFASPEKITVLSSPLVKRKKRVSS